MSVQRSEPGRRKVLFVTTGDITYDSGYGIRVLAEAQALAAAGCVVSVACFLHVRLLARNWKGARRFRARIKGMGGRCYLIPVLPDFRQMWIIRLYDVIEAAILHILVRTAGYRVVHGQSLSAAFIGVSARCPAPVVCDMHGDRIDELLETESSPRMRDKFVPRFMDMEDAVVRNAAAVVSVSHALAETWQNRHPGARPASVIVPCAVDILKYHYHPDDRLRLRRLWGVEDDVPLLAYSGSIKSYQRLDLVTAMVAQARRLSPRLKMLYLVSNTGREILDGYLADNNIPDDAVIIESVAHHDVPRYLSAADAGFLLRDHRQLNIVASPTKFAEYLACGVPVIATPAVVIVRDDITRHGVGCLVGPDIAAGAQTMVSFIDGVMQRREWWREHCMQFARSAWSWDVYGAVLARLYADLEAQWQDRHGRR